MLLNELQPGQKAVIIGVKGTGAFRKRITEMGFVAGKEVLVVKKAPLSDPVEYNILGYNVSLRNSEAELIEVETDYKNKTIFKPCHKTMLHDIENKYIANSNKKIHVAFVGNPNSGKTTLFNYVSHSQERVGNYSGVTVEAKEARFSQQGYEFVVTDLPGTYSITAYSPEELYVRKYITEQMPDVVVNVIDSSNLERNLYLTMQLIDMDIRVVVALNMFDELEKSGSKLDYNHLGNMLGIPFVPTVAFRGRGIHALFSKIIEVCEGCDKVSRHIHINYGEEIEKAIRAIQRPIKNDENQCFLNKNSSRFLAIKLLEKDREVEAEISSFANADEIKDTALKQIEKTELLYNEDTETLITDAKYGFIAGALAETLKLSPVRMHRKTESVDNILTHKFWGIPIFIFFMWFTFYATFKLGDYPMQWIENGVNAFSGLLQRNMQDGMLKDMLIQGVIGGVGGVVVFLPNIVLLYLFISLMEDTGYMARAVFIMDKFMHKIGLHGKSFIPLIMGFGCNVPAILSTRIIESKRDRLMTMLINPFMSCSARLPVYILFISAFFQKNQASILFGLYFLGILIAISSALLFKKTIFRKKDVPFVMELPPYRVPTIRSIIIHMANRTWLYLRKIGGIILVASIIIWALGYFPTHFQGKEIYTEQITVLENKIKNTPYDIVNDSLIKRYNIQKTEIEVKTSAAQQKKSYIGRIGHFLEPALSPLGFDWKMSVALLSGISAKEVVVGTLGVLYQTDAKDDSNQSLVNKLRQQEYSYGDKVGQPVLSPLVAMSFMIFILIYFPCIGVVSAISRESGSWKWALFVVVYTTALAYLASLLVYQLGLLIL